MLEKSTVQTAVVALSSLLAPPFEATLSRTVLLGILLITATASCSSSRQDQVGATDESTHTLSNALSVISAQPSATSNAPLSPNYAVPSHSGQFIDPCTFMPCGSDNGQSEAQAYYNAIFGFPGYGATGTFKGWKATFGLGADPSLLAPGEVQAVYYNNADLQIGRDMHCISPARSTASGIACYVSNYGDGVNNIGGNPQLSIANAAANQGRFATVAMVYDPGLPANEQVQFWVFLVSATDANDGPYAATAILDNDPVRPVGDENGPVAKAVPGVCMACHGGLPNSNPVSSASFLPFDAPSFIFSTSNSALIERSQREAIRELNSLVKSSASANSSLSAAIPQLIDGWYHWCGGVDAGDCYIDDVGHPYIPPNWQSASLPNNENPQTFYQRVPRTYCRTCHVAATRQAIATDWSAWSAYTGPIASFVLGTDYMPFGQVPFDAFWTDFAAQSALESVVGACPQGLQACKGGYCVDTSNDNNACGASCQVCTQGPCVSGSCTCAPPFTSCPDGTCDNLQSDKYHCGSCGNVCQSNEGCSGGQCACASGLTLCPDGCDNLMTNRHDCGSCGNGCITGEACSNGTCVSPSCPPGYVTCPCGACVRPGNRCPFCP